MTTTPIPPHLCEAVFRRWEPILITALSVIGQRRQHYTVQLESLSAHTVAAQLRNALRSVRLYGWDTPLDLTLLATLEVIEKRDGVTLRCRGQSNTDSPASTMTVVYSGTEVLRALLTLCEARLLDCVVITHCDPDSVQRAASTYDVNVTTLTDSSVRII